jgi:prevent-host-death family protein
MREVGLRELRQNASELIRSVEAGETVTVTVSGRPAAVLSPVASRTWRRWEDVRDVFEGPVDPDWEGDRDLVDHSLRDPREQR